MSDRSGGTTSRFPPLLVPPRLRPGDRVRLVSPASPPDPASVARLSALLQGWGLEVDVAPHAFRSHGYMAGTDAERLGDLNDALRDPAIRAIFATRGGKGSYRIADGIDEDAVIADPKFLVGFSDISALHLRLLARCGLVGIHGGLFGGIVDGAEASDIPHGTVDALRRILMSDAALSLPASGAEASARLTTSGRVTGPLVGGCLPIVAACAGWALPKLEGAILLLEAPVSAPGELDRGLTMLIKAGHLRGIAGIALGQFTGFDLDRSYSVIDLLADHLVPLGVPVLGGLPLGHGAGAVSAPIGATATLDADRKVLDIPSPRA